MNTDQLTDAVALTYSNPLGFADGIIRTEPDPFGMKYRGRYYCYSTHRDGVNVSVSDDLVSWEYCGFAFQEPGHLNFWAPCVVYYNGVFYMYVSTAPAGSIDPHDERLRLAVADNPLGPFRLVKTLFDKFSIDADVVRDTDGDWYLFYSVNDLTGLDDEKSGTSIVVDKLLDFDRPAGDPRPVIMPTLPEEVFEQNRFGDGRDWYTIEGATYFTHGDRAFLTYSGNAYVRPDYFIGHARAPLSGSIGELNWEKYPSDDDFAPLVRRSAEIEGTGHNSIVRGPDLAEVWMLYHGRNASDTLDFDREQRVKHMDQVWIDGNRLATDAPTSSSRFAPSQPLVRDQFTEESLSGLWEVTHGSFTLAERSANTSAAVSRSCAVTTARLSCYRAELHLAATPGHAGARYGVVPYYRGEDDLIEVLIDSGTRTISAIRTWHGVRTTIASASLKDENLSAFHLIQVDRVFGSVTVRLDGVAALTFAAPTSPAAFGLVAVRTAAAFSGVSLTPHFELRGKELAHLPHLFEVMPMTEVTADGLTAPQGGEVSLSTKHITDWRQNYDLQLLSKRDGRVELIIFADSDPLLTVQIGGGRIHVSGNNGVILDSPLIEQRFGVHIRPSREAVELRVGGYPCRIEQGHAVTSLQMNLTAARLIGFEATASVENHDNKERGNFAHLQTI